MTAYLAPCAKCWYLPCYVADRAGPTLWPLLKMTICHSMCKCYLQWPWPVFYSWPYKCCQRRNAGWYVEWHSTVQTYSIPDDLAVHWNDILLQYILSFRIEMLNDLSYSFYAEPQVIDEDVAFATRVRVTVYLPALVAFIHCAVPYRVLMMLPSAVAAVHDIYKCITAVAVTCRPSRIVVFMRRITWPAVVQPVHLWNLLKYIFWSSSALFSNLLSLKRDILYVDVILCGICWLTISYYCFDILVPLHCRQTYMRNVYVYILSIGKCISYLLCDLPLQMTFNSVCSFLLKYHQYSGRRPYHRFFWLQMPLYQWLYLDFKWSTAQYKYQTASSWSFDVSNSKSIQLMLASTLSWHFLHAFAIW